MRILCFGDSNTWGFIPGSNHLRFSERWTKKLKQYLGNDFEIIEEGLCSRTFCTDYVDKIGRNGFSYFVPCVYSHDKLDCIVLMLGTNDLKNTFGYSPKDIVNMLKKYVEFIFSFKSKIDNSTPKLIVCGTPPINNIFLIDSTNPFYNANKKNIILNNEMKIYCQENNICFVDNSDLICGKDNIHLTQESHNKLALKLTKIISQLKN